VRVLAADPHASRRFYELTGPGQLAGEDGGLLEQQGLRCY
jgi:hypothetical protein